ncbi:MAG: hypothetical protein WC716_08315 [Chitinophagaceae bacterium]|jgi:hypothetical protein
MILIQDKKTQFKSLSILICVLLASRLLFVWLMPATYSSDIHAWLRVIEILNSNENPYNSGLLNYPPFWIQVLYCIGQLSDITSVSQISLIQSFLVIGECLVMLVTYLLLIKLGLNNKGFNPLLVGLALNPVCVLLNCQHGNFDIFVGLWILLFVYLLVCYSESNESYHWLAACFCLGMGIFTKTIPFVLIPLLLCGVSRRTAGLNFFGAALLLTPVLIGLGSIYVLCPDGVAQNVLSYRSMAGWYGITGLLNLKSLDSSIEMYSRISPFMILGIMIWGGLSIYRKDKLSAVNIIVPALTLLVFLPTFGPGYSPPYILWYLPLMVIYYLLSSGRVRYLLITGFIILALTYSFEYAFFNSHGAFIKFYTQSESVAVFSEKVGHSAYQTMIRLPMFLFYLTLFVALLRDKNNLLTHRKTEATEVLV